MFHYIQQEDNTFFFKKSTKERMEHISQLFDTKKEIDEQDKYEKISKRTKSHIKIIEQEVKINKKKQSEQAESITSVVDKVEYSPLFKDYSLEKAWDKKSVNINKQETLEGYRKELESIKSFTKNHELYFQSIKNEKIEVFTNANDFIHNFLLGARFIQDSNKIEKLHSQQLYLTKSKNKILQFLDSILDTIEEIQKIKFQDVRGHIYSPLLAPQGHLYSPPDFGPGSFIFPTF